MSFIINRKKNYNYYFKNTYLLGVTYIFPSFTYSLSFSDVVVFILLLFAPLFCNALPLAVAPAYILVLFK